MSKRNSDNISSEDDYIDDDENDSEEQNDADSVGNAEKLVNIIKEEDDQDDIVQLDDNLDEYLDKYSQFESIKHYDQQISNPNGVLTTKTYVNKSNEFLSNDLHKNKNYQSNNNINSNINNHNSASRFGLMSNEPLIKRNLNFNHSNFNSLKFKRNHKTAMSTTQILSSAHTTSNKTDELQNKSTITAGTLSTRGKPRHNNHQLTPIKTTSNLMSMSTINMTNSSSLFNDTTLLNNTSSTLNKTTAATINNTTTSMTNKYFTMSAAAGQKFRQILKRYVQ